MLPHCCIIKPSMCFSLLRWITDNMTKKISPAGRTPCSSFSLSFAIHTSPTVPALRHHGTTLRHLFPAQPTCQLPPSCPFVATFATAPFPLPVAILCMNSHAPCPLLCRMVMVHITSTRLPLLVSHRHLFSPPICSMLLTPVLWEVP